MVKSKAIWNTVYFPVGTTRKEREKWKRDNIPGYKEWLYERQNKWTRDNRRILRELYGKQNVPPKFIRKMSIKKISKHPN